ncbi:MAG: RNA polymerase sigma factor [Phycisphaerales bacterium]
MDDPRTDEPQADALARFREEAWPNLPALLRVAIILTGDTHQAEDLVQEAMMRAYRHIETFDAGTNMKAWLMTILRRVHIDLYRKASRSVESGSLEAMAHNPAAPLDTQADDVAAWTEPDELLGRFSDQEIEDALRALPDAMRWVLLLVDVEQMSVDEAARTLDVAPGTIKSRASRARALLRERLLPLAQRRGWICTSTGG